MYMYTAGGEWRPSLVFLLMTWQCGESGGRISLVLMPQPHHSGLHYKVGGVPDKL